jgi:hypothetical protein
MYITFFASFEHFIFTVATIVDTVAQLFITEAFASSFATEVTYVFDLVGFST